MRLPSHLRTAARQLHAQAKHAQSYLTSRDANLLLVPEWQLRQMKNYALDDFMTLPFTDDVHKQLLAYVRSSFETSLSHIHHDDIARIGHLNFHIEDNRHSAGNGIVMAADTLLNFMSQQPVQVAGALAALPALPLRVIVCLLWHQVVCYDNDRVPDYSIWLCDAYLMKRVISGERPLYHSPPRIDKPDGRSVLYIIRWTDLIAAGPHAHATMS